MNRKQFILVLAALAIVGTAGLMLIKHHSQSWAIREAKVGDKVLPNFKFNDVAAIHVKSPAADFNVARKGDQWRVAERNDYPANYAQIKDLLMKIRDLKVVQSATVGPSQWARVQLDAPNKGNGGGTLIEFNDENGKLIDALIVGKRHLRPQSPSDPFRLKGLFDGSYVRLPSDPATVLLISDDLAGAAPEPQAWLSRSFVKIDRVKSISLVSTNGANLWTLLREAESRPWSLADAKPAEGEALDPTAASQIAEILPFLTFVDVQPNGSPDSAALEKPPMLFVETFNHFFYTLKIGGPMREGNYLLSVSTKANVAEGQTTPKSSGTNSRGNRPSLRGRPWLSQQRSNRSSETARGFCKRNP